jgi:arylsulfatase A
MKHTSYLATLPLALLATLHAKAEPRPNIVFIIADDLGIGDLSCYGATKILTPRIDRLAGEGVRCTDAHSVCGVCSPSRYSILSGTYLWHGKSKGGYSLYFHDGQITLPSLLKSAGYRTQALGKWHNGFGRVPETDWNAELKPGPLEIGFDHFFGTPRTHNEPPLVFVEDHQVIGLDPADPIRVEKKSKNSGFGEMFGGAKARAARPDERIDFIMAEKAAAFFGEQSKEVPFFLYLAFAAPHVPINPAPEFRGKSGAALYGDYIQQLDHCTGLVLDSLEKSGLAGDTIVIFTSDNGACLFPTVLEAGHRPNRELLGQKTHAWEGGHRVPFLARWPGHFPAGSVRGKLFTQVDVMATLAEAAGIAMPDGASPDGASELAAFTDPANAPARRTEAVFQGTWGYALRYGDWVYLPYQGAGGKFPNLATNGSGRIGADAPAAQLYNLATDLRQETNVIAQYPELAGKLDARLKQLAPASGAAVEP